MKITKTEQTSSTIYYDITAENENGDVLKGTLAVFNHDLSPMYEFTFLSDESDIDLTKKEIEELEQLAIESI